MRHLFLMTLLLVLVQSPVYAQKRMYVTDRIVLDMYEDSSRLSQVLKQLPTGTAMELLNINGPFAEVRMLDGSTGWVEASFLTDEKPIQVLYTELNKRYKQSQNRIEELEAAAENAPAAESTEDTSWMRAEMNKARKQAKDAESKLSESAGKLATVTEKIALLEGENTKLREQLDNITTSEALNNTTLAAARNYTPMDEKTAGFSVPLLWFGIGILVFLIIGIIAGIAILDYRIRQRHGGFRIY